MEIEVRRLNALKKYEGEFQYEYEPPQDCCLVPLCKIEGKVKVSGSYEIYEDDSVGVKLTVNYKIIGQCSYCLSEAEKEVSFTSDILFVTEEDDDNYIYDGIKINLKSAVDDAILLSQPNIILCREGCTGIDVTNK